MINHFKGLGSDRVETHRVNREGSRREVFPLVVDVVALAATIDVKLLSDGYDVFLERTAGTAAQQGEQRLGVIRLSRNAVSSEMSHILFKAK